MSSISQTIPNYVLGMSDQPDQLKSQGQVRDLVNAIPDVSAMLIKRQGSELIEQLSPANGTNDPNEHVGKWFDIYRDPTEQYMGVIRSNGTVQIWRLVNGPLNTYRNTANTADVESRNYVNLVSDTSTSRNDGQGYNTTATACASTTPVNADGCFQTNYRDVATTNTTDGTATGLRVNFEVIDGTCQSVKIFRMGNANYSTGDQITIDGFAGITIEYFEGEAGEECTVRHDNSFVTPYAVPGFTWPFDTARAPRAIVTHTDYLEHTDPMDMKTLTINDTTIMVNRETIARMTNATEPAQEPEGFVEIIQLAFNQVYQYNIVENGTIREITIPATDASDATVEQILDAFVTATNAVGYLALKIGNGLHIIATPTDRVTDVTNPATTHNGYTKDTLFSNINVGSGVQVQVRTTATGNVEADSFTVTNSGNAAIAVSDTFTVPGTALGGTSPAQDVTLTASVLGAGTNIFSLETPERQLLNVFTNEVQDITSLPDQCHHHYRVKIANSGSLEDDYYVRFQGSNNQDGQGVWEEWRGFGVQTTIDAATMPHIMVRMTDQSFLVTPGNWDQREVGDLLTNPNPSFIGNTINNVCLYRNRVGFLSRQSIILSRPGDFYNFFVTTALAVTARDPIDISASATNPATLYDSVEVNAGLLLFSRGEQFMLTTDNDILSPDTAKINFVSAYDYNINISPFTLGTTVGFLNDEAGNSRLYEMTNPPREGQPEVVEQSKIIASRLPSGLNSVASSKSNSVVLIGSSASSTIWGYRYYSTGERRIQNAWFRFVVPGFCIHQTIIRDTWFGVIRINDTTGGNNIVSIVSTDLVPNDITIDLPNLPPFPTVVNLDNRVQVQHADLTYNAANDQTSFTLPWTYAQTKITNTTQTQLMAFQTGNGKDAQCVDISTEGNGRVNTINAAFNTVTLEGKWDERVSTTITTNTAGTLANGTFVSLSCRNETGTTGSGMKMSGEVVNGVITKVIIADYGTGYANNDVVSIQGAPASRITLSVTDLSLWVGYEYTMQVDFPFIYPVKSAGAGQIRSDVQGSLIIHRCKFNTGATGTFNIDLNRVGRSPYSALHESRPFDAYQANEVPLLLVDETTIPCYDRNTNINLSLKSKYPLPVTLISMTWEGEYTNKFYKRT